MPPVFTGLALNVEPDVETDVESENPAARVSEESSRAAYAANDAHNLTTALTANLDWMSRALTLDQMGDDVRLLLCDAVAVCQQLALLLGGAIGCCREATRPKTVSNGIASPLRQVVETVMSHVSNITDSTGVLVVVDGPPDLLVSIDADVMKRVLETLVLQALNSSTMQSEVRLSYTRCGAHAVVGVTTQGHDLAPERLKHLYSMSHRGSVDDELTRPPLAEVYSSLSLLLLEQGGYIDVELGSDEGATVFLVVPAVDQSSVESKESGITFA